MANDDNKPPSSDRPGSGRPSDSGATSDRPRPFSRPPATSSSPQRSVKKTLHGVAPAGVLGGSRSPSGVAPPPADAGAAATTAAKEAEAAEVARAEAEARAEPLEAPITREGSREIAEALRKDSEPPVTRVGEAEVAAALAKDAMADATAAEKQGKAEGDVSATAAARMVKQEAMDTRAEALQAAADADRAADIEREMAREAALRRGPRGADDEDWPTLRPSILLAEYETPDDLVHAAEIMRDSGYEHWDCHTPYPVHGLDQAMGLKETKIGFISFVCGMVGLVSAVLMIQYMNNWDYPIIVGGKPPGAFPSMVPIMFELTVLLTGFGTLFGLFHLARLPRHHHPIFESDRFERATDDRFFISVEVEDPKFDVTKTRALLASTHPSHLELIEEEIA